MAALGFKHYIYLQDVFLVDIIVHNSKVLREDKSIKKNLSIFWKNLLSLLERKINLFHFQSVFLLKIKTSFI